MFSKFISLPFLFLRVSTAGLSVLSGLLQTYVFAHVLTPHRFSMFIIVGTLGFTLLLCDLGVVKLLFVRLRARHLGNERGESIPGQATAIFLLYALLAAIGSLVCFLVMTKIDSGTLRESAEFALFFLFTALNLTWFAMRNVAIAVDEFVHFEVLDSVRRVANTVAMVAMLIGFPVMAFVLISDAVWVIVLAFAVRRLIARDALSIVLGGVAGRLFAFVRENKDTLWRSATFSASEIFLYNFPYFLVPTLYGLGPPTIILDTTSKVFRAGSVAYSAACDIMVPRQTRAFGERDAPTLIRTTLIATGLCLVPATLAAAIVVFFGEKLFAFLLGASAVMPSATTPILVVLLFANLVQMVALSVLVHAGFFKFVSRAGLVLVAAMLAGSAMVVWGGFDFIGFLTIYTAIYSCGAFAYAVLAVRGPIRVAAREGRSGGSPAETSLATNDGVR